MSIESITQAKFKLTCRSCGRSFHGSGQDLLATIYLREGPLCSSCLPGTCYYCGGIPITNFEGKKVCLDCFGVFRDK